MGLDDLRKDVTPPAPEEIERLRDALRWALCQLGMSDDELDEYTEVYTRACRLAWPDESGDPRP